MQPGMDELSSALFARANTSRRQGARALLLSLELLRLKFECGRCLLNVGTGDEETYTRLPRGHLGGQLRAL